MSLNPEELTMPAFLQLGDIKGEAQDQDHKDWIMVESFSAPIVRSVAHGARNNERRQGQTTLGDIHVVRKMDKSSTKLSEACATGKFIDACKIDLCATINGKQVPIMQYALKNVIITSYNFHATESMKPSPSEEVSLSFTDVEWTYSVYDDKGNSTGKVPGKYNPHTGQA
jgi:type VI secretion system secreted protein Hcp